MNALQRRQMLADAILASDRSFTDQGTVLGIGPEPLLGYFTLDGSKNLQNEVATSNLNGLIASETFFGTYTVNPDCTGTLSVAVFAAGAQILAVTLNVVFDSDMTHMRRLLTSARNAEWRAARNGDQP